MKLFLSLLVAILFLSSCKKERNFSGTYYKLNDTHLESVLVEIGVDSERQIDGKILKSDVQKTEHMDLSLYTPTGEGPVFIGLADLKIFKNLTFLGLAGNIQESTFNPSENPKLDTLRITGTQITSLDLRENSGLRALYLSATKIDTLDLQENSELIHIEVYDTPLRYLSVGDRLKNLIARRTQLKSIDLSSAFQLTYLDCEGSLLTEMDLSSCGNLDFINLTNNYLRSLKLHVRLCQDVVIAELHLEDNRNYLKEICVCDAYQANANLLRKLYIPYYRWTYAWTADSTLIFKECN